jgi:hypothetical protein
VNSDTEFLRLLDADPKILIAGNEDRIADRSIPSECDHICDNQRVHAFLFADTVHEA